MATYATESARDFNRPAYFIHVEGLPYLWFTRKPANWSAPASWTYSEGLYLVPDRGVELTQDLDPLAGVEDASSLSVVCYDSDFLSLLAGGAQGVRGTDHALLATNDVAPNSDANLATDVALTGAATGGGTIYIGRQTITYTSRSGVTFSGVDRGKYHSLDSALAEVEFKPEIRWSAKLNAAPRVTTYPRVTLGRTLTLYRIFLDEAGNGPTDKSEHRIRFRGTIDAVGDSEDHLGLEVKATSIIDLLDAPFFSLPFEAELKGYNLPKVPYVRYGFTNNRIHLREALWDMSASPYAVNAYNDMYVNFGTASYYDTPDALAKAINAALDTAWSAGSLWAPWQIKRASSGRFEFGYEAVGYTSSAVRGTPIAKSGTGTLYYGVRGQVVTNDITAALGFGGGKSKRIDVGSDVDGTKYRDLFARYTNPSYYASMLIAGNKYRRIGVRASARASAAWFRLDECQAIPADFDSNHEFDETPGDSSPFLVNVADTLIYRCAAADSVSKEITLDASYPARGQWWWHIGAHAVPDKKILAVPDGTSDGDRPVARQAWKPSCETNLLISGSTYAKRRGVEQLLLQIMLSTGEGSGYNSDWDILPADWALQIPESYVDTDSFERLRDVLGHAALQRRYIFTGPTNFRELLETEAQTLGFYVVVSNGKITAVPQALACAANSVAVIDDDARAPGDITWQTAPEGIINAITLHHDYDVFEDEFYRHLELKDTGSMTDHGRVQELEIENKGIRGKDWRPPHKGTVSDVEQIQWDRMADWCDETFNYTCPVNRSVDHLCVGDHVLVTDARIPNPFAGTRGINLHPGVVQAFSFNDHEGVGELTVRLNYKAANTITVGELVSFNSGTLAQGGKVTAGGLGNTLTIDTSAYQPNSAARGYLAGDQVQCKDIETGETWHATVTGWNSGTGQLTLDRAVGFDATDGRERIVTWTSFDRSAALSTTGREAEAAHLADSSGNLAGTMTGYRQL